MMECVLEQYGGAAFALPPLLEWSVALTGGVPCDSFQLRCPYVPAMAEQLETVWRATLRQSGQTVLRAVVDEHEIVQDGRGQSLCVSGRGLAALLLDNEAEAVEYSCPVLSELLRSHAAPCGISWTPFPELRGAGSYAVASGSSQWKALSNFTRYFGGFEPRMTAEGVLVPTLWKDDGTRHLIRRGTPILELRWKERRYGVYSEVLVVDKVRRTKERVVNAAFAARGGSCRKVLYTPGRSTGNAMRYTGAYQIARSQQGAREMTVVLSGAFFIEPGSVVRMERADIGITGDFYVEELVLACDGQGERTTLTMRRLTE